MGEAFRLLTRITQPCAEAEKHGEEVGGHCKGVKDSVGQPVAGRMDRKVTGGGYLWRNDGSL